MTMNSFPVLDPDLGGPANLPFPEPAPQGAIGPGRQTHPAGDDDGGVRLMLSRVLKSEGYDVVFATTGPGSRREIPARSAASRFARSQHAPARTAGKRLN